MKLLETEVRDLHPRLLSKLLDNAPRDLTVACELMTVGADKHELELALISLTKNERLGNTSVGTYTRGSRRRRRSIRQYRI